MLKILIWRVSDDMTFQNKALKILEQQHNGIELVGVTANTETSLVYEGRNVNFIPLAEVDGGGDYEILVVGAKKIGMSKVILDATQFHLPEEKLLGDWIVCIPGFTLDKYRKLQRSRLSILSSNCFGGLISHNLGLPFRTPIINMFFREQEYIKFLGAPRTYIEEQVTFKETLYDENTKINYPVVTLGNVEIHMNHYRDFNKAVKTWEQRKQKINWYNLFVTAYTESEDFLREFDTLPYGKKVCLVPFKSDLDSAWYINRAIKHKKYFWQTVNNFAKGNPFYYDPFDMLLYGKKTQLIDM